MIIRNTNNTKAITENLSVDTGNFAGGFIIDDIFKGSVDGSINEVVDYEIVEFKPNRDALNFNIFFFRADVGEDVITNSITHNYESYRQAVKTATDLILKEPVSSEQLNYSPVEYVLNSERTVRNTPLVLNTTLPSISGTPNFYNTFSFPFYGDANNWYAKRHKFNNEQYLYNSFLLFEFYNSPKTTSRERIFSQVIFPNPRYIETIAVRDTPWTLFDLLTPSFYIDDSVDNYRINWVDNDITEFYVQVYFWNALTGEQIPLLPTTDKTKNKQWIQPQNTFDYNHLYLKYILNSSNKTYTINVYNETSGEWDYETTSVDFYQLIFDEYWSKHKPDIVIKPDVQNTAPEPIIYDVAVSKDNINEIRTSDSFINLLHSDNIFIKNTGTRSLKLRDAFISWVSPDERIVSDEVLLSNWNESDKTYTRNFYSFIQNQTDYAGLSISLRQKFPQFFPIDNNDANKSDYRSLFGEKFEFKVSTDRNKIIMPDETISISMRQTLGSEYEAAYIPNISNFFIPTPIFDYYYNIFGAPFEDAINIGISFPISYSYKIELILTDEFGNNEIRREINYNLLYNYIL